MGAQPYLESVIQDTPIGRPGTVTVKKDTIKIHCLSEPHKVATNLGRKIKMEAQPYLESLIQDTPIDKAIT